MSIQVRQHQPGKDVAQFVAFHHDLFRNDPVWIAPLDMEVKERLTPGKNPFFEHGEATLFTAWEGARMVGRISAQVDHEHLRIHHDETGFFGFLDTVEDPEVAKALVDAAAAWLRDRGMKAMRGPYNLSINEEIGTLVDGFEHAPTIMTPYSKPYQGALIESTGLEKVKDLYYWRYAANDGVPSRAQKAWDAIDAMPEVRFRSVDPKRMLDEVRLLLDIHTDAWSANWGFVPITEAELHKVAADMKLILDPDLAFFVEIDGRPMGVCVALPNLNEAIADLDGKLLPFGIFKILWRTKVKKPKSIRLILLGLRQELRGVKRYGPLSTAMYAELVRRGHKNYEWAELGWTLEDNRLINLAIKAMRGKLTRTYRVYEKSIDN